MADGEINNYCRKLETHSNLIFFSLLGNDLVEDSNDTNKLLTQGEVFVNQKTQFETCFITRSKALI